MDYRIIADSCLDLTPEMKTEGNIKMVPLTLQVDGVDYVDDDSFDQKVFLKAVDAAAGSPKSSCPSPEDYKLAFGEDEVSAFCVTLSSELSGSYNSAVLGQRLVQEEFPNKKVHIFNSRSASAGETLIAMKVKEYAEAGCSFEEVVEKVEEYISQQTTLFVLDNLDTLRKNGRLTGVKATLVSVLNIKPVMASTPEGTITQLSMGRGTKKGLKKMVEEIGKRGTDIEKKAIAISHCNCPERAELVKAEIEKLYNFKQIVIEDTGGVSTMYANDGGIVIAF
ncbi:MAG: DegV family protein [Clostridia bacterium]|nr:DegV family protein [Clostridia bacterium]